MKLYTASEVASALPYEVLIAALREAFREGATVPLRTMHSIEQQPGTMTAVFALMPAWRAGQALVVKLATIFAGNADRGLPTIHAQIVMFDGETGVPTAIIDGTEVTRRRTACASALAATYLARQDATRLLVVGTGAQAPHNALAHAAIRPIRHIEIWGRTRAKAEATAELLRQADDHFTVRAVDDLEQAVRAADVITCATMAKTPIVMGKWLSRGTFLDLVGAHTPVTRECDDEAVRSALVYVDTRSGAMEEAGDIIIPIQNGVIGESHVVGDLYGLCRDELEGRKDSDEITLFKSVGTSLEDLAAAQLVASTTRPGFCSD